MRQQYPTGTVAAEQNPGVFLLGTTHSYLHQNFKKFQKKILKKVIFNLIV